MKPMKTVNSKNIIRFEEIFEPTLKKRFKDFLESDCIASHLTKALLIAAVFGGILFVGATAPNLFSALGKMGMGKKQKITREGFYRIRKAFYALRRNKFIRCVRVDREEEIYQITEKGKEALRQFNFENIFIPKPAKWDHKWRVIIFDIPHSKKAARDALRRKLIDLDCYPFQKSVWVHPFPCLSEISYVADVFKVNSFVDIFTIDDFDNIGALNHFRDTLQGFLE